MRTSILGRVTLNLFQTRSVHIGRVTLDIRKGALFRQGGSVHKDHMQGDPQKRIRAVISSHSANKGKSVPIGKVSQAFSGSSGDTDNSNV